MFNLRTIALLLFISLLPVAVHAQQSSAKRKSGTGTIEGPVDEMGFLDGGQETNIVLKSNGLTYRFYIYPPNSIHLKKKNRRFRDSRPTEVIGFPNPITDFQSPQKFRRVRIYYVELRPTENRDFNGQIIQEGKVIRIINLDNPTNAHRRIRH